MNDGTQRVASMDDLAKSLSKVASHFEDVRRRAEGLGIFTADRELLECPACGLVEDVAHDGRLMTYKPTDNAIADTGLRFRQVNDSRYRCPCCGTVVEAEGEDEE